MIPEFSAFGQYQSKVATTQHKDLAILSPRQLTKHIITNLIMNKGNKVNLLTLKLRDMFKFNKLWLEYFGSKYCRLKQFKWPSLSSFPFPMPQM